MAKKPVDSNKVKAAWDKAQNKAKTTWKESRKAKGGGGFEEDPIEDGTYAARLVKAEAKVTKKGDPFTVLTFLIVEDCEFKGQKHRRTDYMLDDDDERQSRNQANFAKLMSGMDYDVEKLELNEIPDLMKALNDDKPFVEVYIKNWQGDTKHGINIYVNKVLSEDDISNMGLSTDLGDDDGDGGEGGPKKTPPKKTPPKKVAGSRR